MTNKHIFNLITQIAKPSFKNKSDCLISIIENWNNIVPNNWKGFTTPIQLKWDTANLATLIVSISSSSLSVHLNYESNAIIKKLNNYLGQKIITKIKFVNS
ncbi:DciA family protein [Rickettsiales bacterium LUAb2]